MLFTAYILCSVAPVVFNVSLGLQSDIIAFIVFYFTGAYIYRFDVARSISYKRLMAYIVLGMIMAITTYIACQLLPTKIGFIAWADLKRMRGEMFFCDTLIIGISLFEIFVKAEKLFEKISFNYKKMIVAISSMTLEIYIIHNNRTFRDILWNKIWHVSYMQNSIWLPMYSLIVIIGSYIICVCIEESRLLFVKFIGNKKK